MPAQGARGRREYDRKLPAGINGLCWSCRRCVALRRPAGPAVPSHPWASGRDARPDTFCMPISAVEALLASNLARGTRRLNSVAGRTAHGDERHLGRFLRCAGAQSNCADD